MHILSRISRLVTVLAVVFVAGCGGGGGSTTPVTTTPSTFSIGGSVTGLGSGVSVTLLDNGSDSSTVSANGAFTFPTPLATSATYNVTVGTQPSNQVCTVTNGSGTVGSANVTSVQVACVANQQLAYNASPGQTALWADSFAFADLQLFSLYLPNLQTHYQYSGLASTSGTCQNSGSAQIGGGSNGNGTASTTFSYSNCQVNMGGTPFIANGSTTLTANVNNSAGTCSSSPVPGPFSITWSLNKFSFAQSNPTLSLSGSGQLRLSTISTNLPSCQTSTLTVPMEFNIPSSTPLSVQFEVQSTSGSMLGASITDLTLDEIITSTTDVTQQSTTYSTDIVSGGYTINGIPYSMYTSTPITTEPSTTGSGGLAIAGVLQITGGNETDTLTITGLNQLSVVRSINGTTTTNSTTITSFLGL